MSRTDDFLLDDPDDDDFEEECDRCGADLGIDDFFLTGGQPLCSACYEEDSMSDLEEDWFDEGDNFDDIDPDTLSDEDL